MTRAAVGRLRLDEDRARYYGKYRGTVINSVDPQGEGRIQVQVSEISPVPLANWARMCTPVGGLQNGFFAVPPPGAGVWIEFESGDPDYPIWSGCFVGSSLEVPKQAPQTNPVFPSITLQTPTQNCVVINDLPGPTGGVQLRVGTGASIKVTNLGIEIDNGAGSSIKMIGPTISIDAAVVKINQSALVIM